MGPKQVFPECPDLLFLDHETHGFLGDPGITLEFTFELAAFPAGVSDERADLEAFHLVHHRFRGGKVRGKLQRLVVLGPAESGESEVFRIHRSTEIDRHLAEFGTLFGGKDVVAEKFADGPTDRTVQDVAERAVLPAVFGEEQDALEESRLLQRGIGEENMTLERVFHGGGYGQVSRRGTGRGTTDRGYFGQEFRRWQSGSPGVRWDMQELTEKANAGGELTPDQIESATEQLLDESLDAAEKASFLEALAEKGETPAEIAAFASCFLKRAVSPEVDHAALEGRPLIDVCGTGGDKLDLFNVSTTSVFLLAACGAAVVKHGNRGITSKSGGADALEALGIRIDLPPDEFGCCLAEVGAGFLFAPAYHPAFKAVVPVRKLLAERGKRTVFNILGPLLNPARPDYQLVGVFDPTLGPVFADILGRLGRKRAWAVHGDAGVAGGMDELSTLGPTRVWESGPDTVASIIEPSSIGISPPALDALKGGEAAENASMIEAILAGTERGPKRDIAALNCAAGLVVTGIAADLAEGYAKANEAVDSGAAKEVLVRWRAFS